MSRFGFYSLIIFSYLASPLIGDRAFAQSSSWLFKVEDFAILSPSEVPKNEPQGLAGLDKKPSNSPSIISDWSPLGGEDHPLSAECNSEYFESSVANLEFKERQNFIQSYYDKCEAELTQNRPANVSAMFSLIRIYYDAFNHPDIKPLRILFSDKSKVNGVLALKPDSTPRPLVIVRSGLMDNGSPNRVTAMLLAHLFDENPFHVIVLGSHSDIDYVKSNHRLALAGFSEGREMMALAHWLKNSSSLSSKISSVHSFGISFGGNASLMTSIYNSHYVDEKSKAPLFNSSFALCPVVDTQLTVRDLFEDQYKSQLMGFLTRTIMKDIHPYVPELQDLYDPDNLPPNSEWPRIIAESAIRFFNKQDPWSFLSPFKGHSFIDTSDYWNRNNYLKFVRDSITPTLAIASHDDEIVSNKKNTLRLKNIENKNVLSVNTNYGSHCAFSMAYGWNTTTQLFRAHILKNSPEFKVPTTRYSKLINFDGPRIMYHQQHAAQIWKSVPNKDYVELKYKIFDKYIGACGLQKPQLAHSSCFQNLTYKIPRTHLSELQLLNPHNQATADAESRWLNTHVLLQDENKNRLTGTRQSPGYIKWRPE